SKSNALTGRIEFYIVIINTFVDAFVGNDSDVLGRNLNPSALNNESHVFKELRDAIYFSRNPAVVSWVGEGGGVWNSGRENVLGSARASTDLRHKDILQAVINW
ncbi:glucuronidase 3, partial [Striga asiatica]